ncbi:MAG: sulfite exporter TauE/SafE family protein, partial [Oscillospiraceae bacterium]|nr:sulfite exporter TauE/SafE family protein [Oscillospiraceae bacterium]
LLLSGFAHISLKESNGIAKSINLTTNLSSLAVYLMNGKVIILLGLAGGLFGIVGNYIGVTFFKNKGAKAVRPLMIMVLVIFFIKILTEII